jgi:GDP/UDP-N,N'-diacetylbacillosamine 2-epimerase (hydrolysing)
LSSVRRIAYVTGTRADFGLMQASLQAIHDAPDFELIVYPTGMHLDTGLGHTLDEVLASGFDVASPIEVEFGTASGALTAKNIGHIIVGTVTALSANRPDILLLLGDRGEMLAAALAAIHLNIPIVHIHGGERSGTVDEPIRHAISKLAHLHLVSTQQSRERLIKMGEQPDLIRVVGAPGLDGISQQSSGDAAALFTRLGLSPAAPVSLFLFHPVLQEADTSSVGARAALDVLLETGQQILALKPNSDAGSAGIIDVLNEYAEHGKVKLVTHLARNDYLCAMRNAALLVGNSSSGIIEAASFGTPVVNIGSRQNLRERNSNVIDVSSDAQAIAAGVTRALEWGRLPIKNVYGNGQTAGRIVEALRQMPIGDRVILGKINAY